ncbi:MAG: thioredoxin [Clostridia bacterium]|nr:thioredoxin [Clostridia bacterium]
MELNVKNFEKEVLEAKETVLVDFWASWCMPCRMLSPVIEEIEKEHPEIKVGKVNVDEEPELAIRYGVSGIPTVLIFRDGKPVKKSVGFVPKENLTALL